jgi:hypothetical protein
MRAIAWLTLACLLPAAQARAGDSRHVSPQPENNLPEIVANENRAKDGAELPPAQATLRSANQVISVGETYDFEFEPPASRFSVPSFRS